MLWLCHLSHPKPWQPKQQHFFWDQDGAKAVLQQADIHRAVAKVQFEWVNCAINGATFQLSDLMDAALQICSHGNVETAVAIQAVSS